MSNSLYEIALRNERDVVQARQCAREIAGLLGFDNQEQIRIATATSEMARNSFRYARNGKVRFSSVAGTEPMLQIDVTDSGPGISNLKDIMDGRYRSHTGMGLGIIGTKRLMDKFDISSSGSGTVVHMAKLLPVAAKPVTPARLRDLREKISASAPESPYEEIERQNRELLKTLQELRARQEELANLNRELEDTNRGVVALYAELDERADYLRRASELKTKFLSNVSHEFRTPLNSIISLARMLLDRLDGDLTAEQETQVRFILESAKSLSDLVHDLLDLAKVEAGKVKIRVKSFEVSELFSALNGMLKPLLADNRSVDLVFEELADLPSMRSDEGKVSQILRNFISNAIKFTPQGEVRVSAAHSDGRVTFCVADTGIGIAPENQDAIFEEFTQLENPLQERFRGTGLGLPLCRKLAMLLGGKVWVESELGRGSRFFASIPAVYSGSEQPAAPEELPAHEFARPVVLLADPRYDRFTSLEPTFRSSEFQLVHVASMEDATRWLEQHVPAAIVCNLDAFGGSGWDFLRVSVRQSHTTAIRQVPFVGLASQTGEVIQPEQANLLLPPATPAKELLKHLRELTRQEQPRKLLLVDDNDLSLYILRELLNRPWLNLVEAHNGQEALEMVRREKPDAIILDLVMPGLSGFDVLEQLRATEETRTLPVIIYTSKAVSVKEKQTLHGLGARLISKEQVAGTLTPEALLSSLASFEITGPGGVAEK